MKNELPENDGVGGGGSVYAPRPTLLQRAKKNKAFLIGLGVFAVLILIAVATS